MPRGFSGMGDLVRQAQKMQHKMAEVQQGLEERVVEGAAGGAGASGRRHTLVHPEYAAAHGVRCPGTALPPYPPPTRTPGTPSRPRPRNDSASREYCRVSALRVFNVLRCQLPFPLFLTLGSGIVPSILTGTVNHGTGPFQIPGGMALKWT
jgi:hypothetical protein